jgi:hypothetical protein
LNSYHIEGCSACKTNAANMQVGFGLHPHTLTPHLALMLWLDLVV